MQHRTLLIGAQQCGVVDYTTFVTLLRQQQISLLNNGVAQCALNFGCQATFTIKALVGRAIRLDVTGEAIQWIVVKPAQQNWLK